MTHIDICQRASCDKAHVDWEEGIGVAIASELQTTARVLGVDSVNGPDERIAFRSPVGISSDGG